MIFQNAYSTCITKCSYQLAATQQQSLAEQVKNLFLKYKEHRQDQQVDQYKYTLYQTFI